MLSGGISWPGTAPAARVMLSFIKVPPESMEEVIRGLGRVPRQRTTLYGDAPIERRAASFGAAPLTDPINTPARRWERHPEAAAAD